MSTKRRDNFQAIRLAGASAVSARRRGTILIVTMTITFTLAMVVLVLGRKMAIEAKASANQAAAIQASAVERAAEQYVIALLNQQITNAAATPPFNVLLLDEQEYFAGTNYEGVPVGDDGGRFWILRPDYGDPGLPMFGLVDEASKLNINVGFPNNQQTEQRLLGLPGFTQNQSYDIADSIISWRDANGTPYGQGAGPAYYAAMDPPYFTKLAGFETVEELLQVQGFEGEAGRQILFGDGTAPPLGSATSQSGMSLATNGMGNDPDVSRGLYDLLTVNSTMSDGGNGSLNGPINLSTAPPQVLACLQYQGGPIPPDILQQLISERSAAAAYGDPTNTNWVTLAGVMTPNSDFTQLNPASTPPLPQTVFRPSYRYSADILAVSANGRAFKRVKVIFDTQATDAGTPTNQYTGATLPIQIVYRRDFTEHGWPMDPQVLEDIRAGKLKQQAR